MGKIDSYYVGTPVIIRSTPEFEGATPLDLSMAVSIYDPDGEVIVEDQPMTENAGVWDYTWQSPDDAAKRELLGQMCGHGQCRSEYGSRFQGF
jgi:hypothetical protein